MDWFLNKEEKKTNVDEMLLSTKKNTKKNRYYHEEYIKYGFIEYSHYKSRPQCLICYKVLSNESLKPFKLERHLLGQHSDYANKPKSFFQNLKKNLGHSASVLRSVVTSIATPVKDSLKASYLVALRISRVKKPHTIAETLIFPCIFDVVDTILGKENSLKSKSIPHSNNTIARRIEEMSFDIKKQLISRLKHGYFAIQLDESTDVGNLSNLLVYIRYCWKGEILEYFLFCSSLPLRTSGEDVFNLLNNFFLQNLVWSGVFV